MKLIRHVASFLNVDGAAGADSSRNLDKSKNKGGLAGLKLK